MRSLIKVVIIMGLFFASTFVIVKGSGVLSIDQINGWLVLLKESSSLWIGITISLLLLADLLIAVPTLSVCILSGYFLGFQNGVIYSSIGIILAGVVGYLLSKKFGNRILDILVKKEDEKIALIKTFNKHGVMMILLSRSMPILPEVSACLSGMTQMNFSKFIFAWLLSSVPYLTIANYIGSISSLDNPKPAIFTAIGFSIFFWGSWFIFFKKNNINN